jgi:hypothetical protein
MHDVRCVEMPSKEERRRRRALVRAIEEKQSAEAVARMPISRADLYSLFAWVDGHVMEEGCNHTLRHTREFIRARGLAEEDVLKWLAEYGGGCDCEVILNVEGTWREYFEKEIQVLDVVALIEDIPERGLRRGQVGTIVESLDEDVFEVEFSDDEGRTYASAPLSVGQMRVLHYEPAEELQ